MRVCRHGVKRAEDEKELREEEEEEEEEEPRVLLLFSNPIASKSHDRTSTITSRDDDTTAQAWRGVCGGGGEQE